VIAGTSDRHNRFRQEKTAKETETFFQLEYIDPVDTPLVEFHFKYRSKGILAAYNSLGGHNSDVS
jgi:hypothetical protein